MSLVSKVYIAAFLLTLGTLCNSKTTESRKIKVNDSDNIERFVADDDPNNGESAEQEQDSVEKIMPILPPIILLDFDNSTDDNATADEKSKRTVNNNLGYGFDRNFLHAPRKYNYYFPAGKTGTTVTIEESISPFLPKTIIEKVPSSGIQKPVSDSYADLRSQQGSYKNHDSTRLNFQSPPGYQYYDPATISQPVFGLRTKLTKTSDSERYRGFSSSARPPVETYSNVDYRDDYRDAYASTTPRSLALNSAERETGYITPSPQSYTVPDSNRYVYVTSSSPSRTEVNSQRYFGQSSQHAINVQGYSAQSSTESSTTNPVDAASFLENIDVRSNVNSHDYIRPSSNTESPTSASGDVPSYSQNAESFANLPRYTVENNVRYENKIFWRYPDGRVSDMPPKTYETYSEYSSLAELQAARSQDASKIDESVSTENRVLSQGPVQFPISPEPNSPPTSFISAESLSSPPQQQVYRLGYQNLVGRKQIVPQQTRTGSGVSFAYSTTLSPLGNSVESNGKNRYETSRRPTSKYMVNSPNPEYVDPYTTESAPRSTTPSKAFISSTYKNSAKKINASGKNLENYSNLQYGDLLNYNPSISQYIKNPSSILNVRPTFVQAGNSLIPVIILRVDGVPPIQPNATPNVNLKALLQQYLLQYARSIEELARPTYDFGSNQFPKEQQSLSTSPLRQLVQLIQNSNTQDLVGNPTESYVGRSSYEASNLGVEKSPSSGKYGERTAIRPKVKSVQIVEDPRFENYRIKN